MNDDFQDTIMADLRAHPGSTVIDIATRIGASTISVGGAIGRLSIRGLARQTGIERVLGRKIATWEAGPEEEPDRLRLRPAPFRDAVLADLRAHPGSTANQIAARIGCHRRILGPTLGLLARAGSVRRDVRPGRNAASLWSPADGDAPPKARKPDFITPDDLAWMARWRLPRAERKRLDLEANHAL